jgi:hypothetical protein
MFRLRTFFGIHTHTPSRNPEALALPKEEEEEITLKRRRRWYVSFYSFYLWREREKIEMFYDRALCVCRYNNPLEWMAARMMVSKKI